MNIFCKIFFLVRSGKFFPILFRKKTVKKNWDILARSCITKKVHRADLMLGYRKPRDLRRYLARAKTDYDPTRVETGEGTCADNDNKC